MYLSRVKLNTKRRETICALGMPSHLHAAVERAVNATEQRKLWRIDELGSNTYLLILSQTEPDLEIIREQFGFEGEPGQSVAYDKLLANAIQGSRWHFRLVANPVHSIARKNADGERLRGRVYNHQTVEQQQLWLSQRAESCGFALQEGEFAVVGNKWFKFYKGAYRKDARPVSLLAVAFEGVLTVTDAGKFAETLQNGIGRGKAYGMGMLTIAR